MKRLDELGVSPAPWTVKQTKPEGRLKFADLIMDGTGKSVATVLPHDNHPSPSTRLMAAAPDLYEALRKIVSNNECGLMCNLCAVTDRCEIYPGVKALEKAGGAK